MLMLKSAKTRRRMRSSVLKIKGEEKTCSEWIDEKGLLCKNSKRVKKNCNLSCGKCTASPTESPTDAICEDKEGKFKVRGKNTCAELVELCPGSCGKCPPTASPTASPTDSPTASPTASPTPSPTEAPTSTGTGGGSDSGSSTGTEGGSSTGTFSTGTLN